jgi:hypothetical protein
MYKNTLNCIQTNFGLVPTAHGYILPMENVFSYDQDSQEQAAQAVIDAIARDNTGQKVVIHCFSNNSFNLYRHVST